MKRMKERQACRLSSAAASGQGREGKQVRSGERAWPDTRTQAES